MPLRFIKYKAALLEDYLHGKPVGTPWPMEVHSYFADPLLAEALRIFQNFHLIDLTIQDDAQLQQHASLGLMERILKYSRERDFFNTLSSLLKEYKASLLSLESPLGHDYWYAIYLVAVTLSAQHGHSVKKRLPHYLQIA